MKVLHLFRFATPAFLLALPLTFVAFWHTKNTILPFADDSDYLLKAYEIYLRLLSGDIFSLFNARLWKPILVPVLQVPFLFLADGNALLAFSTQSLFITASITGVMYMVFRERLPPLAAALGTTFILTQGWFLEILLGVNSETYSILSLLTILWCALRLPISERAEEWAITYGISAALGLCVRPFELGYYFSVDLIKRMIIYAKNTHFLNMVLLFSLFLFPLFQLVSKLTIKYFSHDLFVPTGIADGNALLAGFLVYNIGVMFWLSKHDTKNRKFYLMLLPIPIILSLFYHTFWFDLVDWLQQCTTGTLGTAMGGKNGRRPLDVLTDLFLFLFHPIIIPFVLFSLGAVIFRNSRLKEWKPVLYTSIILIITPFISDNTSERYYLAIAMTILMTTFILCFTWRRWWTFTGRVVIIAVLIFNILRMVGHQSFFADETVRNSFLFSTPFFRNYSPGPDLQREMAFKIVKYFRLKNESDNITIGLFTAGYDYAYPPLQTWGTQIALLEMRSKAKFIEHFFLTDDLLRTDILDSPNYYDYILVGPIDKPTLNPHIQEASLTMEVARRHHEHVAQILPIELKTTFQSEGHDGSPITYLFYKVRR